MTNDDAHRLERLLDGAPPRDAADRETLALLAAIRDAEPPAPPALHERVAALEGHDADELAPSRGLLARLTGRVAASRRRLLWLGAPVAAAALAAAIVVPAVIRDGDAGPTAAPMASDSAAALTAVPAIPSAAAPAASEATEPRMARAPAALRVRVADDAALAAAGRRAVTIIEARGGHVMRGRAVPQADERRIMLVVRLPRTQTDAALTALGALGHGATVPPAAAAAAASSPGLRVVFEVEGAGTAGD